MNKTKKKKVLVKKHNNRSTNEKTGLTKTKKVELTKTTDSSTDGKLIVKLSADEKDLLSQVNHAHATGLTGFDLPKDKSRAKIAKKLVNKGFLFYSMSYDRVAAFKHRD